MDLDGREIKTLQSSFFHVEDVHVVGEVHVLSDLKVYTQIKNVGVFTFYLFYNYSGLPQIIFLNMFLVNLFSNFKQRSQVLLNPKTFSLNKQLTVH